MNKSENNHRIVIGGQHVSMGALLDLQRDAARYRWLRDKADSMACTAAPMVASLAADGKMVALIDGEDLDSAVDIAMARPKARRAAGFIDLPSLAMLAGVGVLCMMAFTPLAPVPQIPPAPAAVPGSGVSYAPYVFLDNETGCQYLSTHTSTGMVPRIAADGRTHLGCKGPAR